MTRQEFIKNSAIFGIGLPFFSSVLLQACGDEEVIFPNLKTDFKGKVLIIGAGAAGMAAAYTLQRYGVDYEVLEASSTYGGRVKRHTGLADFPIDIGAEWIHTDPSVLANILNDPNNPVKLDIIVYNPQTIQTWNNGKLRSHNYIRNFYSEWKFKSTTWFGFFEQFIIPQISSKISYYKPVSSIDYTQDQVVVKVNNLEYKADKVIVTVPVKMLQLQNISFNPPLPVATQQAFDDIVVGDGIKIFVQFNNRFYPDLLGFGNILQSLSTENKYVYDAAFRKDSSFNVLGLFAINEKATEYIQQGDEQAIINYFLAELDEIFDGQASANYDSHVIQNWSAEPYIQGAYSYEFKNDQDDQLEAIHKGLADKVFFAGEALVIDHQSTVHGACQSGMQVVERILKA